MKKMGVLMLIIFVLMLLSLEGAEKKAAKKNVPAKVPLKVIKLYYSTGEIKYIGEVINGVENGKGTSYNYNGKKMYEGDFKDGLPNGKGIMYDDDEKASFEGDVKNGMPTENGKWYNSQGTEFVDETKVNKKENEDTQEKTVYKD